MLGTLRFFLASLVALSHIGWLPFGINPGIAAVVVFYMISGYVVSKLWFRLQNQPSPLTSFYADRFLRIYPTYLFVFMIGLAVYLILSPESHYLSVKPGVVEFLENLTIIPLNFYMFNDSHRFVFIPPAWSLGAEIQFYLLLPLLIRFPLPVFLASLLVAILAQAGVLPREWFTYRLLPGVLHIFMAGALLGMAKDQKQLVLRLKWIWGAYATCLVLLVLLEQLLANREPKLYVLGMLNIAPELLLGLLVGLPMLVLLAPMEGNRWDRRLGDISYGVFLNHFIVYWVLTSGGNELNVPVFLSVSALLSFLGWYIVEKPAQFFRYSLRKKRQDIHLGSPTNPDS